MYQLSGPSQIISMDETVEVSRIGQVVIVGGKPVDRKEFSFLMECNVQPLAGLDLLMVPEGDRYKESYWVYTNELSKDVQINDRIIRNGISFQAQKVETWGSAPNGYQRILMVRTDTGPHLSNPKVAG